MLLASLSLAALLYTQAQPSTPGSPPPGLEVPPSPAPSSAPPVVAPSADTKPKAPNELSVGTDGLFRPYALLQGWVVADRFPQNADCMAPGCELTRTSFRIRRAELGFTGQIIRKRLSYRATIDPSRTFEFRDFQIPGTSTTIRQPQPVGSPSAAALGVFPGSNTTVLNDLLLTFESEWADVTLGQFRIPVSLEGSGSSGRLILPERSVVSRFYGDRRDIGLRVTKTFEKFGYYVGVFDGAGQNALDTNNEKDLGVRLEAYPLKGMTLALVEFSSVGLRANAGTRDRWELDFRWERGPALLQSEFIRGRDNTGTAINHSFGYYVGAGWTFAERFQPVVRFDFLDPGLGTNLAPTRSTDPDELWGYEAGLNVFIRKDEAKIQTSFSWFDFHDKPDVYEAIVATQVFF